MVPYVIRMGNFMNNCDECFSLNAWFLRESFLHLNYIPSFLVF